MTVSRPAAGDPHGRDATSPFALPGKGWKDVVKRTFRETGRDNIGLIAAGVAFYAFLSIVPLLGATVLTYGLVANPATVLRDMQAMTAVLPADAARLIGDQLLNVVTTSGGKKGLGLLLALGLAIYGAMKAASAIVTALNIAYEEEESRGFVKLNFLALAITVGAVLIALLAMIGVAAPGHLESLLPSLPRPALWIGKILSYAILGSFAAAAAATLFRYGPDRSRAQWAWLTPGSLLFTLLWLALTLGFGAYVANFGDYDATYGSLSAVVVLLTWIWLSAYVLLLGAELNSELEHQTAEDTTAGPAKALGDRKAVMANRVADTEDNAGHDTDGGGAAPAGLRDMSRIQKSGATTTDDLGVGAILAVSAIGSGAARVAGGGKPGMLASLLVASGVSFLQRKDRARLGIAFVVAGSGLAWLRRKG